MDIQERLLAIMDGKHHPAWPRFGRPGLSRAQLLVHFRHEYRTYVRDFPVLLSRVLGQGPPRDVRVALAENVYEEQTGKLSMGVPHPDLFLEMMEGIGLAPAAFEDPEPALEPEAIRYRAFLDRTSTEPPWIVGCAVLTIFVEGSVHERAELAGRKARPAAEELIREHPLVRVWGCPPEKLRLPLAHLAVEGSHRADAWRIVLGHATTEELSAQVVAAVRDARDLWMAYRDGVVRRMDATP